MLRFVAVCLRYLLRHLLPHLAVRCPICRPTRRGSLSRSDSLGKVLIQMIVDEMRASVESGRLTLVVKLGRLFVAMDSSR